MNIYNIIGYNFSKIHYFGKFSIIWCYLCRINENSVTIFMKSAVSCQT